ncbi:hypothetical protein SLEP1_g4210 [Rubroshorea leprosula]|nr:hypothetical protein SLEP1_g4210 [Rubroshorea leprosula]
MAGGSMYDVLRKQKCGLELPFLLEVAIHVSNGMSYLHQKNIIHRDLKAANLLLDEKGVRNFTLVVLLPFICRVLPKRHMPALSGD